MPKSHLEQLTSFFSNSFEIKDFNFYSKTTNCTCLTKILNFFTILGRRI